MTECKCLAYFEPGGIINKARIQHCPLHAAADKMKTVLEAIRDESNFDSVGGFENRLDVLGVMEFLEELQYALNSIQSRAKETIALAEGRKEKA